MLRLQPRPSSLPPSLPPPLSHTPSTHAPTEACGTAINSTAAAGALCCDSSLKTCLHVSKTHGTTFLCAVPLLDKQHQHNQHVICLSAEPQRRLTGFHSPPEAQESCGETVWGKRCACIHWALRQRPYSVNLKLYRGLGLGGGGVVLCCVGAFHKRHSQSSRETFLLRLRPL